MKIYLDTCVLNRLTDDLSQERLLREASAIAQVLDGVAAGQVEWIASSVLRFELSRNIHPQRRSDSLLLLSLATSEAAPTQVAIDRALQLRDDGYGSFDSLHLALAEQVGASVLLTVDDRFLRRAAGRSTGSLPTVENPIDWMRRRQPWLIKR